MRIGIPTKKSRPGTLAEVRLVPLASGGGTTDMTEAEFLSMFGAAEAETAEGAGGFAGRGSGDAPADPTKSATERTKGARS